MQLRQLLARLRIPVVAEPQKLLPSDRLALLESQPLRTLADPIAGLLLA